MRLALLVFATFIWGLGFVATRWTLTDYSPIWSNSLRYVFAALISIPFLLKFRTIKDIKGPLICAALLLIALQLQTVGIGLTTLAKSGFLTVFYSIFTPILSFLILKQRFRKTYWALVTMAMMGILMLCNLEFSEFNLGDMMTLASALFFSLHILAVDRYAMKHPAIEFNFLQCFYMGVMGFIFATVYEGLPNLEPLMYIEDLTTPSPLLGFVILSIFSSIIAFSFQVYAQQGTPPHIVSLCFLLESIFATFFGYLFFNEKLTTLAIMGCVLVLFSVALLPSVCKTVKAETSV